MGIVSDSVAVALEVQPLDEALGVLSKQLLHEPVVLWHRGGTTSALPPVGLQGLLGEVGIEILSHSKYLSVLNT